MEVEPSAAQRRREIFFLRFRAQTWLVPILHDKSALGWMKLLFIRWLGAFFWTVPGLLLLAALIMLLLPLWILIFVVSALRDFLPRIRRGRRILHARSTSCYREAPLQLFRDCMRGALSIVLLPEIWIESKS